MVSLSRPIASTIFLHVRVPSYVILYCLLLPSHPAMVPNANKKNCNLEREYRGCIKSRLGSQGISDAPSAI